jgi:hypothetical protein
MTKHKRRKQSGYPCPLCAEPRPNSGLPIAIPFLKLDTNIPEAIE